MGPALTVDVDTLLIFIEIENFELSIYQTVRVVALMTLIKKDSCGMNDRSVSGAYQLKSALFNLTSNWQ